MNFEHLYLKSGFDIGSEHTLDGKAYIAPKTHACLYFGYWCWSNIWTNPGMFLRYLKNKIWNWRWRRFYFPIYLFFHINITCRFWDWRIHRLQYQAKLTSVYRKEFEKWMEIDRKEDNSLSANDFGFWLYLRKIE